MEGYSNLVISEYDASTAIANGTQDYEAANNAFWWLLGTLFDTVFKTAGFEPPEVEHSPFEPITYVSEPFNFSKPVDFKAQAEEDMGRAYQVYVTTFGYFMLSTGIMLILFALLASLSTRDKSIYHYIRIGASAAIGTGICLLTTLLTNQSDLYYYVISPWVLPTVTLSLFISKYQVLPSHDMYMYMLITRSRRLQQHNTKGARIIAIELRRREATGTNSTN